MPKYDSKLALISLLLRTLATHLPTLLSRRISTLIHKFTYKSLPPSQCKNVLILGASFSGTTLASRLSDTLPTGYRVILLEKNSHFNYSFVFPRFSVFAKEGSEGKAFIPYSGLGKGKPKGIFEHVRGMAVGIDAEKNEVLLENGERVSFEYLAVATGCTQPFPARIKGSEKVEGIGELRGMQEAIGRSGRIAVVGGGAVGVQLVGDIKSWFPEKEVVLVHSREWLMSGFGERLGGYVKEKLKGMGIIVKLGERPDVPSSSESEKGTKLKWKDGSEEVFDLVIPCTGQTPNSSLLTTFSHSLLSKSNRISVLPTLQLTSPSYPNIFALGDVAETPGPKMARAGMMQAEIVVLNILSLIQGKGATKEYVPNCIEGALKLSLGRKESVMYVRENEERDILIPTESKSDDLDVGHAWGHFGADVKDFGV